MEFATIQEKTCQNDKFQWKTRERRRKQNL